MSGGATSDMEDQTVPPARARDVCLEYSGFRTRSVRRTGCGHVGKVDVDCRASGLHLFMKSASSHQLAITTEKHNLAWKVSQSREPAPARDLGSPPDVMLNSRRPAWSNECCSSFDPSWPLPRFHSARLLSLDTFHDSSHTARCIC